MNWDWRAIKAIMRKDLRQVLQNRMVWLPMIILPVILQVLIPLGLVLMPLFVSEAELGVQDMAGLLGVMPDALRAGLEGLTAGQMWIVISANYMFAPMFLIVPLMVASILAADSFVGEKERGTLEGLFYTPVSDRDLFFAKVLTAFLPALAISVGAFIAYAIVVNVGGYATMGRIFFPTAPWWPLVFWLGPAVSAAGLGVTVLISSKARTFMQAQQTSGILVLPIVFLMIAQLAGLFFLGAGLILFIGALVWVVGLWLIWLGARTFSRSDMIARV
jgi:ABC-type Na+ efflux pump permease subunit